MLIQRTTYSSMFTFDDVRLHNRVEAVMAAQTDVICSLMSQAFGLDDICEVL